MISRGLLANCVGPLSLYRGDGMCITPLVDGSMPAAAARSESIEAFPLRALHAAFSISTPGPNALPEEERGQATISGELPKQSSEKEKKKKSSSKKGKKRSRGEREDDSPTVRE